MDGGPLPTSGPLLKLYTPPLYPLHSYDAAFIFFLFKDYVQRIYADIETDITTRNSARKDT
jgi:outer membrane translocation and assembly module TamA